MLVYDPRRPRGPAGLLYRFCPSQYLSLSASESQSEERRSPALWSTKLRTDNESRGRKVTAAPPLRPPARLVSLSCAFGGRVGKSSKSGGDGGAAKASHSRSSRSHSFNRAVALIGDHNQLFANGESESKVSNVSHQGRKQTKKWDQGFFCISRARSGLHDVIQPLLHCAVRTCR